MSIEEKNIFLQMLDVDQSGVFVAVGILSMGDNAERTDEGPINEKPVASKTAQIGRVRFNPKCIGIVGYSSHCLMSGEMGVRRLLSPRGGIFTVPNQQAVSRFEGSFVIHLSHQAGLLIQSTLAQGVDHAYDDDPLSQCSRSLDAPEMQYASSARLPVAARRPLFGVWRSDSRGPVGDSYLAM
jgi:hypothetical protein